MDNPLRFALLLLIFSVSISCTQQDLQREEQLDQLHSELLEINDYFHFPGFTYAVIHNGTIKRKSNIGYSDVASETPVSDSTLFPVASLTKTFSSVLLQNLHEENLLNMDDPITRYVDASLDSTITVAHVLSHTSQGDAGKEFYYSFRFSWLTSVIEQASGKSYKEYLHEVILEPLGMGNTFVMDEAFLNSGYSAQLAQPYNFEGERAPGNLETGYSASAGIVSNISDMTTFHRALHDGTLLTTEAYQRMFSSPLPNIPYGQGIFVQHVDNNLIYWTYGQYDSYSSLYLFLPDKELAFIAFANNNLMSDPARLIMGDATSSLLVLTVLKNLVYGQTNQPLIITEEELEALPNDSSNILLQRQLLAQALAESFLSRYHPDQRFHSYALVQKTLELFPEQEAYVDVNTLFTLSFLTSVSFHMNLEPLPGISSFIEDWGNQLAEEHPNNPYIHSIMGTYYDRNGNINQARFHYESIVATPNFSPHWYTRDAEAWLSNQN